MKYSFTLYLLLFVIKITSTFDETNQFTNDNNNNKHEQQKPCSGYIQSVVRKFNNTTNSTNYFNYPRIPLDIIKKLNEVTSVSELFRKFIPQQRKYENTTNIQKSSVIPKIAACTTEVHTVSLRDDDNPNLYFSPYCTRVKRCGGCCGSDLVSCQPSAVELLNFEVIILQYNNTFTFKEKKNVTIEQHVKCACDCTIKEKDCIPLQFYDEKECQCFCKNLDEQNKCVEEIKRWNSRTCTCQCNLEQECTTGFVFDYKTCRCESEINIILGHKP